VCGVVLALHLGMAEIWVASVLCSTYVSCPQGQCECRSGRRRYGRDNPVTRVTELVVAAGLDGNRPMEYRNAACALETESRYGLTDKAIPYL